MIRYQGESIDFYISINEISTIEKWDAFSGVDVYLYTDISNIVKFCNYTTSSKKANLTMSADKKTLSGVIPSDKTKTMQGALRMDILAQIITDTDESVYIKSLATGINIQYAPIKAEL